MTPRVLPGVGRGRGLWFWPRRHSPRARPRRKC